MNRWGATLVLLILAGAAVALRWPALEQRPLHNDEAVNAIKFGELWEKGTYRYDPHEYHGPTLHYASWALAKLTGNPPLSQFSEGRLRAVSLFCGVSLILLLPLFKGGISQRGILWTALCLAVSPSMAFYSAYFIHEMVLVFFTLLALGAGWRYWHSRRPGWALLTGAALGGMHATKETFVITLGCAAMALAANWVWSRKLNAADPPSKAPRLNWSHLTAAMAVWLFVAAVFFTSFFANAAGLADSIRTYLPWLERAGGASPHIQPWWFYLQRLTFFHPATGPVWTEGLILILALYAGVASFRHQGLAKTDYGLVRFLTLHTVLLAGAYSFLSYKTPWCLLNFWISAILLAGIGAAGLLSRIANPRARFAIAGLLLAGCGHLAVMSLQAGVTFAADRRNPYVYAQTSTDLRNLVAKVIQFAEASPKATNLVVKVIAADGDYWPLPWYFRGYRNTGWYDALPQDPFADVMVVSAKLHAELDEKQTHLMIGYFQLRPDVFLECYVEKDLWIRYLAKHPPKPDPE
jgi:uncharacterized protein (TIGR03663 family)